MEKVGAVRLGIRRRIRRALRPIRQSRRRAPRQRSCWICLAYPFRYVEIHDVQFTPGEACEVRRLRIKYDRYGTLNVHERCTLIYLVFKRGQILRQHEQHEQHERTSFAV